MLKCCITRVKLSLTDTTRIIIIFPLQVCLKCNFQLVAHLRRRLFFRLLRRRRRHSILPLAGGAIERAGVFRAVAMSLSPVSALAPCTGDPVFAPALDPVVTDTTNYPIVYNFASPYFCDVIVVNNRNVSRQWRPRRRRCRDCRRRRQSPWRPNWIHWL